MACILDAPFELLSTRVGALRFGEKGLPLSSLRKKYAQVGNSEGSSLKNLPAVQVEWIDNSLEFFWLLSINVATALRYILMPLTAVFSDEKAPILNPRGNVATLSTLLTFPSQAARYGLVLHGSSKCKFGFMHLSCFAPFKKNYFLEGWPFFTPVATAVSFFAQFQTCGFQALPDPKDFGLRKGCGLLEHLVNKIRLTATNAWNGYPLAQITAASA